MDSKRVLSFVTMGTWTTRNNVIKIAQKLQMDGNAREEASQLLQLVLRFAGTEFWLMESNVMMQIEKTETDAHFDASLKKDGLVSRMEREP